MLRYLDLVSMGFRYVLPEGEGGGPFSFVDCDVTLLLRG